MTASLPDTNLLLLWLVGRTDLNLVQRFKRVQSFEAGDVALLTKLLGDAPMVTTPHILAEVSNFVRQAPLDKRALLSEVFRGFALEHVEIYEEAKVLARSKAFISYGLADAGIFELAARHHVITVDCLPDRYEQQALQLPISIITGQLLIEITYDRRQLARRFRRIP